MSELSRQSTREAHSHVVRDSGGKLHLEFTRYTPGRAVCGRRCGQWNEKSATCWEDNPDQRCANCEAPLGPAAVIKP